MKEFIEKQKARLQAFFEPFNEGGSWMALIGSVGLWVRGPVWIS